MGIWSYIDPRGPPPPERSSDGGSVAPNRSSREQCYVARDTFFDCLDSNGILDAVKDDGAARKKCGKEIAEFETACSKTWAKYFKEKRVMEYNRDRTIDKIQREDAEKVAELKSSGSSSSSGSEKKSGGIF